MEIKTTKEIVFENTTKIESFKQGINKKWVSVESILSEIKTIKELVKKHRLEHAGLGWLEARLYGIIIDLEKPNEKDISIM